MIDKAAILEQFTAKAKTLDKDGIITLGHELYKIDADHILFDILLEVANENYGLDISSEIADAWFS